MLGLFEFMRTYELVVVLRPTLKDADKKKLVDTVKGWFGPLKITKEDDWGQKPLSYPIKKEVAGVYLDYHLEGENVPADLEKKIINNDNVLRHLLIRNK